MVLNRRPFPKTVIVAYNFISLTVFVVISTTYPRVYDSVGTRNSSCATENMSMKTHEGSLSGTNVEDIEASKFAFNH